MEFLKLFSANEREIKRFRKIVDKINALEPTMHALSDEQLRAKTDEFKERYHAAVDNERFTAEERAQASRDVLNEMLPEAFAVVREASVRTLGMRHFDVQLIGGIVLHQGRIAEMKTGEGKTLVATLPLYLNAITGRGVHLVTVNDYLSKRDARWNGPIFHLLGLSVGSIHGQSAETGGEGGSFRFEPDYVPEDRREWPQLRPISRKEAYDCDITYGTNHEFGFDYLRDNMAFRIEDLVQRELHYAIVDEVDSILIDEARTPLIISGYGYRSSRLYYEMDRVVRQLVKDRDYTIDEKARTAMLTEEGIARVEQLTGCGNLSDPENLEINQYVNAALKAHAVFKKDVDYVVRDGQVIIVDEFTGRLMFGRRWSDGLHQAVEAKENVKVEEESQTLATITYQNYFRLYEKLAGMTGTALTEEDEFRKIYALDVVAIPTNRPMIRRDQPDVVYKTEEAKFRGITTEVLKAYCRQQPVLVGTRSVEVSERLHERLGSTGLQLLAATIVLRDALDRSSAISADEKKELHALLNSKFEQLDIRKLSRLGKILGVDMDMLSAENVSRFATLLGISPHAQGLLLKCLQEGISANLLNAKHHESEANILREAGRRGCVTIATNMAGRGVDIILGGAVTDDEKEGELRECVRQVLRAYAETGRVFIGTHFDLDAQEVERRLSPEYIKKLAVVEELQRILPEYLKDAVKARGGTRWIRDERFKEFMGVFGKRLDQIEWESLVAPASVARQPEHQYLLSRSAGERNGEDPFSELVLARFAEDVLGIPYSRVERVCRGERTLDIIKLSDDRPSVPETVRSDVVICVGGAVPGERLTVSGEPLQRGAVERPLLADPSDVSPDYEKWKEQNPDKYRSLSNEALEVVQRGGLYIVGSERHESRRIDNQLRGRSGRQGDPGLSRFFVSLEDELWRLFGDKSNSVLLSGWQEDQAIDAKILSKMIERAQKKVEMHHFDMRKHVLEYDDVMNVQRETIYSQRKKILEGVSLRPTVIGYLEDTMRSLVASTARAAVISDVSGALLRGCPEDVGPDAWELNPAELQSVCDLVARYPLDGVIVSPASFKDTSFRSVEAAVTSLFEKHYRRDIALFWQVMQILPADRYVTVDLGLRSDFKGKTREQISAFLDAVVERAWAASKQRIGRESVPDSERRAVEDQVHRAIAEFCASDNPALFDTDGLYDRVSGILAETLGLENLSDKSDEEIEEILVGIIEPSYRAKELEVGYGAFLDVRRQVAVDKVHLAVARFCQGDIPSEWDLDRLLDEVNSISPIDTSRADLRDKSRRQIARILEAAVDQSLQSNEQRAGRKVVEQIELRAAEDRARSAVAAFWPEGSSPTEWDAEGLCDRLAQIGCEIAGLASLPSRSDLRDKTREELERYLEDVVNSSFRARMRKIGRVWAWDRELQSAADEMNWAINTFCPEGVDPAEWDTDALYDHITGQIAWLKPLITAADLRDKTREQLGEYLGDVLDSARPPRELKVAGDAERQAANEKLRAALAQFWPEGADMGACDTDALWLEISRTVWEVLGIDSLPTPAELRSQSREEVEKCALDVVEHAHLANGRERMREAERHIALDLVNRKWIYHLDAMDYLREGIGLRGYAQRDPIIEYRNEAYELFQDLLAGVRDGLVRSVYHVASEQPVRRRSGGEGLASAHGGRQGGSQLRRAGAKASTREKTPGKIGRNDPCPCGSGKKYKKCCLNKIEGR